MKVLPFATPASGYGHRATATGATPAGASPQDQWTEALEDVQRQQRELDSLRMQLSAREATVSSRERGLEIRENELRWREAKGVGQMYAPPQRSGPGPLESFVAGAAVGVVGLAIYLASH